MVAFCQRHSQGLQQATKALQHDRDLVMAAISNHYYFAPMALEYASPKLHNDKRIARAVLNRNYGIRAFQFLSKKRQDDGKLAILGHSQVGTRLFPLQRTLV